MKKNLTFLTGIVFLFAILVTGSCQNPSKKKEAGTDPETAEVDSTNPTIYLKDTIIEGSVHLLMHNERHPDRKVINDLVTVVHPGDIVKWKKTDESDINKIKYIRIKEVYGTGFSDEERVIRDLIEFEIPSNAKPGIFIYEIGFTVKQDTTTHIIDPYLRVPPASGGGDDGD